MRDNLDELRHIEGFPLGEDEDLHALSDPPYYTAYPNPHIAEFIQKYGKPYDEATDDYQREPYVADVSEGKSDPIYMAHTYHTKVPYKAIVPFIEHYTEPGDIVFDGFCGTGMTGVAAQRVGRRAILNDLSPAATFIAHNINSPPDIQAFAKVSNNILRTLENEIGWVYETRHTNGKMARVDYVIWSDIFICPYCCKELNFWNIAIDTKTLQVAKKIFCSHCNAEVNKRELDHAFEEVFDNALQKFIKKAKQTPVLIVYSLNNTRFRKKPDTFDIELIKRIGDSVIPFHHPMNRMPDGDESRRNDPIGMTHVHHFYTKRNLWVFAALRNKLLQIDKNLQQFLLFTMTSFLVKTGSKLHNIGFKNNSINLAGQVPNTLYSPSLFAERNVFGLFSRKIDDMVRAFSGVSIEKGGVLITTQSMTSLLNINSSTIDYIFVDPPFGSNLMYSELSFIWESWLRVYSNNREEAIINFTQGKNIDIYRDLMTKSFGEMYRILKPGHWITIEFHNSKASVWNSIQEALSRAGFIVAQVSILNKQQGTFVQMTSTGAVKNDLVINAYKPRSGFTQRLLSQVGQGLESDFVQAHLRQLPIAPNAERGKEMLYSKYLAYYVQHGYQVQYNGEQFYRALPQWGFVERDGYWFADEAQAQEYERRKVRHTGKGGKQIAAGQQVLFISDEKSARQWLWGFLNEPKSYDEVYTAFVKALQTSQDQIPEPSLMLEEGFVRANSKWKRPDALTQAELEKRRQERLLRQFNEYLNFAKAGQRLKEVRLEALVAGFTECYRENRFEDILAVGRKLHKRIIEENADIFDFIDIAGAKLEK
jgi:hypothetical protein